jgi:diaminopimelate epimerase
MRAEHKLLPLPRCRPAKAIIIFDNRSCEVESPESLSVGICDRHYGIGGYGIVSIEIPKLPRAMRIFNRDGSEARWPENSIRCVAKYLYDKI